MRETYIVQHVEMSLRLTQQSWITPLTYQRNRKKVLRRINGCLENTRMNTRV